jgi:hypothetical protein
MNRKARLKFRILLGFVDIYLGSFVSVFSIIFAFFNQINGFPHPYYLFVGISMYFLISIVFDYVVWGDIEELTILKIKESEKNEEGRTVEK